MWDIIPYITSAITLLALGFVIYYKIQRAKIKAETKKLENVPSKDRAVLIKELEEKYHFSEEKLTADQKFNLIKLQLADRSKKRKDEFKLALSLALILVVFLVIYLIIDNSKQKNAKPDIVDNDPTTNDTIPGNADSTFRISYELPKEMTDSIEKGGLKTDPKQDQPEVSSKPIFIINDPSKSLKLKFGSLLFNRIDTITCPKNISSKKLLSELLKKYNLNKLLINKEPTAESISWFLMHENEQLVEEDMDKKIDDLKWKNLDLIGIQYLVTKGGTAKVDLDFTKEGTTWTFAANQNIENRAFWLEGHQIMSKGFLMGDIPSTLNPSSSILYSLPTNLGNIYSKDSIKLQTMSWQMAAARHQ